jgi:hypothetical protein
MSAWARLVSKAGPEELEELNAALLEIQRETSRRNAARIRAMDAGVIRMAGRRVTDVDLIADLIDPEVIG